MQRLSPTQLRARLAAALALLTFAGASGSALAQVDDLRALGGE